MRQLYPGVLFFCFLLAALPAKRVVAADTPAISGTGAPAAEKHSGARAAASNRPRAVADAATAQNSTRAKGTAPIAQPASAVKASSTTSAGSPPTSLRQSQLPPMTIVVTATRIPQPIGEV